MAGKILKTEAEWQTCLTPEEYEVMRQKGSQPLPVNITLMNSRVYMFVLLVDSNYFNLTRNMIPAPAGPVFRERLIKNESLEKKMIIWA